MLESIRKRKNSIVILAAFAAIILVFIFWGAGPGGNGDDDRTVVATVDGTPISSREYASLYKRELDYYRNTFKDRPADEIAQKLDLKNRALSILINRTIAIKAANEDGLSVSKDEVHAAIQSMPVFGANGVFDKKLYFDVLSSNRINPADFEKGVEEDLLAAKVRDRIVKGITVSEAEAKDAYFKVNRKVDLSYIAIGADRFKKGVEATKEEAQQFLRENGSLFMLPARVKAYYAYADYSELAKKAAVRDSEIKELYDKNSSEYMTPEKVKARHILIRPEAKGAEDLGAATQEARKKAEEVLSGLKTGGKFAELARKHSKDPGSAKQGGDLGWFERGVMIKPFEDAVFSMKKGETSGVVETEFGFHIIRLDDKSDSALKPFNEVKKQIRDRIAADKAHTSAREASLAIMNRFRDAKTENDL
ncbi:MAG: SurA N-terminal domain-containing protein, partial [Deltaproteobacteria bacterium]|nr:SurA N-terminal domain-containing protein [Deltaproteobacteria bacterium]